MKKVPLRSVILLIISVGLSLLSGIIGSLFTQPNITIWYATLNKPVFTPPDWIFAPVWIILYILMGISLFLVIREYRDNPFVGQGVAVFAVQLVLNVLWSIVFFGMHAIFAGLVIILLLAASIAATMYLFRRISWTATWLLIPYICWVSFAAVLNAMILILN
jgi:tryptophan-rich sensory protein